MRRFKLSLEEITISDLNHKRAVKTLGRGGRLETSDIWVGQQQNPMSRTGSEDLYNVNTRQIRILHDKVQRYR